MCVTGAAETSDGMGAVFAYQKRGSWVTKQTIKPPNSFAAGGNRNDTGYFGYSLGVTENSTK